MSNYGEGDSVRTILLGSSDGGVTWTPITNPVGAGGGGGTADVQYVEDIASTADPTGTALVLRRHDTLSTTEVSTDLDWIVANATNKGEMYVKHVDVVHVDDNAGSLTVDGTVGISGTVPVSGPLTDAQLRASTVPISGTVTASGPLTDTQLRASAVPVSGPLTDAQLRASVVPVDTELTTQDYDSGVGTSTTAVSGIVVAASGGPVAITGDVANGLDVDVTRVSGTVTTSVSNMIPAVETGLAKDATLTGGTQRSKITDGTNNAALAAAAPAGTEQALIVRNIPSGTQAVSGTVAATQSGTWTDDVTDRAARLLGQAQLRDATAVLDTGTAASSAGAERGLYTRPVMTDVVNAVLTLAALNAVGTLTVPDGQSTWNIDANIASASNTYTFEGSVDGTNWFPLPWLLSSPTNPYTSFSYQSLGFVTGHLNLLVNATGFKQVRVRNTAYGSGSDTFTSRFSRNAAFVTIVTPQLTKGSQTGLGLMSQQVHDSGRKRVNLLADAVTPTTPEALVTIQKDFDGTVTTGVTEYVVTTGKILRVTGISIDYVQSSVTATTVKVKLRRATATLTATSALELSWHLGPPPGTLAAQVGMDHVVETYPEGMEFAAADHIGFTAIASTATTGVLTVRLTGYEY